MGERLPEKARVTRDPIHFFDAARPYGEFSNFYVLSAPLLWESKQYDSSEHLYHALKYLGEGASDVNIEYADEIRRARTPYSAKILAAQSINARYDWQRPLVALAAEFRVKGAKPRPDWDAVKVQEMARVLDAKFSQSEHCRRLLLSTGDRVLAEASPYDSFWGIGGNGKGRNELGKLLMALRTTLKERHSKKPPASTDSDADIPEKRRRTESEKS